MAISQQGPISIFLTNLAAYNRGDLVGKWYDLPGDVEEMEKEVLNMPGSEPGDEELFITDFESNFHIDEYENISELNEFAEKWDGLNAHEQMKVVYLVKQGVYRDKNEAIDNHNRVEFWEGLTLEDLAAWFVEEGLYGNIPEAISHYIDYKKIARDLEIEGYDETDDGVFKAE